VPPLGSENEKGQNEESKEPSKKNHENGKRNEKPSE